MVDKLFVAGVAFLRNLIGIIIRPYETYRRIVEHGSLWELPYIGLLVCLYLAAAALVRTAAFRPFLLTKQFMLLAVASGVTYVFVVVLLWMISKAIRGRGGIRGIALAWAYTLVPTVAWFLSTSIVYIVLPPPRTTSFQGVAFSLLFLVFSATLFFWKGMLAYLTLRFGMKLDLPKIGIVAGIGLPVMGIYSVIMYRLGVFRVPFL